MLVLQCFFFLLRTIQEVHTCRSVDLHLRDNISAKLYTFIAFLLNLVCSDQFNNNRSVVDLSSDDEDTGNDGKSSGGICTIMLHCLVLYFLFALKNSIA